MEKWRNFQKNSSLFLEEMFPDKVHKIPYPQKKIVEVDINIIFGFALRLDLICLPTSIYTCKH